jgi:DNA (cytosine-5)-methyltransferase 1
MRPRLLDLFCKAGGAGKGYADAGFEVIGVDIEPQPRYPFEFHQADALAFPLDGFDAVHASPPCPAYSKLAAMHPGRSWPKLIEPIRERLIEAGVPYVIENVEGAPLVTAPTLDGRYGVVLCGSMFGLGVERGFLRRHRLFETTFPVAQPSCSHKGMAVGAYGHGGHSGKARMLYRAEAAEAMGIDWMNRDELSDAIPPAYTQHVGRYLLAEVQARQAA